MSCELGQDPSVAEVVGEVRLAATGELLSHVAAAANRSALEIAGLSPGEVSILSVPIQTLFPLLLFWLLFLIFCQNYGYFPKQVARWHFSAPPSSSCCYNCTIICPSSARPQQPQATTPPQCLSCKLNTPQLLAHPGKNWEISRKYLQSTPHLRTPIQVDDNCWLTSQGRPTPWWSRSGTGSGSATPSSCRWPRCWSPSSCWPRPRSRTRRRGRRASPWSWGRSSPSSCSSASSSSSPSRTAGGN